jgi:hypothetical protein
MKPVNMKTAKILVEKDATLKAAVVEGRPPVFRDPFAKAVLFTLIKDADAYLRERRQALLDEGWTLTSGTLGRGTLLFSKMSRPDRVVTLDRRR